MFKRKQKSYSLELSHLIYSSSVLEYKQSEITEGAKLGTGGFGKVVEGLYKTLKIAIKKIKQYDSKAIYRELFIMKKFNHPYIPQLYGIIKKPMKRNTTISIGSDKVHEKILGYEKNPLSKKQSEILKEDNESLERLNKVNLDFIIELVEGESLEKMLTNKNSLTNLEKIIILLNLATVLEYLHGNNLIHRDLKPDNIMIDKKFEFKLLDFGISKVGSQANSTRTVSIGTMMYMAPENFNLGEEDECEVTENTGSQSFKELKEITEKVDVWAFGCIVQQVMVGVKPWMNKVKTNNKILSLLYKKIPFEISNLVKDEKTRQLIQKCTQINPEKRISIKEAKILMLEILFNEFQFQAKSHNLNEDTLEKGLISIYKMFESISNKEKFHLIRKVQFYIFEYFRYLNNKNHDVIMHNKSLLIKEKEINKLILESKNLHDYENIEHVKQRKLKGIDRFLKDLKFIEKKKIKKIFNLDSIIMKVSRRSEDFDETNLKSILKSQPNKEKTKNLKVQFKISFDNNNTYHILPRSPREPVNHSEKTSKRYAKIEKVEEFQLLPHNKQLEINKDEKDTNIEVNDNNEKENAKTNSSDKDIQNEPKNIPNEPKNVQRSFKFINKLKKSINLKENHSFKGSTDITLKNGENEALGKNMSENKLDHEVEDLAKDKVVNSPFPDKSKQITQYKFGEEITNKPNIESSTEKINKSTLLKVIDDLSTENASPITHPNINKSIQDNDSKKANDDSKLPESARPEMKKKRFIFESLNLGGKINNDKVMIVKKMERKFSNEKLRIDLVSNIEIAKLEKSSLKDDLILSRSCEISINQKYNPKKNLLEIINEVNLEINNFCIYNLRTEHDIKKTFPIKLNRIPSRTTRAKLGRSDQSSIDNDLTSNHSLIKTTVKKSIFLKGLKENLTEINSNNIKIRHESYNEDKIVRIEFPHLKHTDIMNTIDLKTEKPRSPILNRNLSPFANLLKNVNPINLTRIKEAADLSKLTRPHYKNIILEKLAKKYPKKLKLPSESHDYISISKVIFSPNDITYK